MQVEEGLSVRSAVACDLGLGFLWVHGWVNKRKFKGACLSQIRHLDYVDDPDEEKPYILRAKAVHGWLISIAGDTSGCGWDVTMYFRDEEPVVADGRWDGAVRWDSDADDEVAGEVVDGPHKVTMIRLVEVE